MIQLAFAGVEVAPPPPPPPPPPPVAQKWAIAVLNNLPVSTTSLTSKGLLVIQIAQVEGWDTLAGRLLTQGFKRDARFNYSKISRDKDRAVTWWACFAQSWDDVAARAAAEAAAKRAAEPQRINGIAALDEIIFDGTPVTVVGIDEEGLLLRPDGDGDDIDVTWVEIEVTTANGVTTWQRLRKPKPARRQRRPVGTFDAAELHRERGTVEGIAKTHLIISAETLCESIDAESIEDGIAKAAALRAEDRASSITLWHYDGKPRTDVTRDGIVYGWSRGPKGWIGMSGDNVFAAYFPRCSVAPAKAPKTSKPAKVKPHRQQPVPEADELAQRGQHVYTALVEGLWTCVERKPRETGPVWEARYTSEAAQGVRVRVYDGSPRCTWDSLDGAP